MSNPLIVVDAHQDIAFNYCAFGRDYRQSAYQKRDNERMSEHVARSGIATLGLPDAIVGRVAITFATLFVSPRTTTNAIYTEVTYTTPREAYQQALRQWDYYQRLTDEDERLRLITTQLHLDEVLSHWQEDQPLANVQQGMVLLMEGADPVLEPKQFEEWYERGVRVVGLAWGRTRYSGGTGEPGGLSSAGRELLDVLASHNVLLDLSHLAEQACFEALDAYQGEAIIASHSNPRHFVDTDRHLSDDMMQRIVERDGVMGIVLYNYFLSREWYKGQPRHEVPFSRVLDVIDYICQFTGSSAHVGIGSDFDGGFGLADIPEGLDTTADLWKIGVGLRERGYAEADIAAILGGNMLRKLRQVLP